MARCRLYWRLKTVAPFQDPKGCNCFFPTVRFLCCHKILDVLIKGIYVFPFYNRRDIIVGRGDEVGREGAFFYQLSSIGFHLFRCIYTEIICRIGITHLCSPRFLNVGLWEKEKRRVPSPLGGAGYTPM